MHKQFWRLHKRRLLIGITFIIAFLFVCVVSYFAVQSENPQTYYKEQLNQLSITVSSIGSAAKFDNDSTQDIKNNMNSYDDLMRRLIDTCTPLVTKDQYYADLTEDGKVLETIKNSKLLCSDLIGVADYTRTVYEQSQEFIELNPVFPATNSDNYLKYLNYVANLTQKTKSSLQNIDNSKVNDPGLEELITHLSDVDKQIIPIKASLEFQDYQSAKQQSDQLAKMLDDDKIHFLSARSYYWNNTIGLASLQTALDKLKSQVN